MGLASSWVLYTAIFAGALALRWVLLRVNKWVYEGRLKGKSYHLPPGDLGWPLIGNMWTFLRAFKTKNPDSFISNIVERFSLSLSLSLLSRVDFFPLLILSLFFVLLKVTENKNQKISPSC